MVLAHKSMKSLEIIAALEQKSMRLLEIAASPVSWAEGTMDFQRRKLISSLAETLSRELAKGWSWAALITNRKPPQNQFPPVVNSIAFTKTPLKSN